MKKKTEGRSGEYYLIQTEMTWCKTRLLMHTENSEIDAKRVTMCKPDCSGTAFFYQYKHSGSVTDFEDIERKIGHKAVYVVEQTSRD